MRRDSREGQDEIGLRLTAFNLVAHYVGGTTGGKQVNTLRLYYCHRNLLRTIMKNCGSSSRFALFSGGHQNDFAKGRARAEAGRTRQEEGGRALRLEQGSRRLSQ